MAKDMGEQSNIKEMFNWNSKPGAFELEEQQITLGPDLSWPLLSKPKSGQDLSQQHNKIREITSRKAA